MSFFQCKVKLEQWGGVLWMFSKLRFFMWFRMGL